MQQVSSLSTKMEEVRRIRVRVNRRGVHVGQAGGRGQRRGREKPEARGERLLRRRGPNETHAIKLIIS